GRRHQLLRKFRMPGLQPPRRQKTQLRLQWRGNLGAYFFETLGGLLDRPRPRGAQRHTDPHESSPTGKAHRGLLWPLLYTPRVQFWIRSGLRFALDGAQTTRLVGAPLVGIRDSNSGEVSTYPGFRVKQAPPAETPTQATCAVRRQTVK